jgi:hypothetical protein
VQGVGVVPGRADRVIPDAVALVTGLQTENTLDPTFTAAAPDRLWQVRDDGVKAFGRRRDGGAHLPDLPLVLDKSQGGQEVCELVVAVAHGRRLTALIAGADGVKGSGQVPVRVAHDADLGGADVLAHALGELVDVAR